MLEEQSNDVSARVEALVSDLGATELTRRMGITFTSLKHLRQGRDKLDSCSVYPLIEMIEADASEEDLAELDQADVSREMKLILIEARAKLYEFAEASGVSLATLHVWMTRPITRSKRIRVAFIRAIGRQLKESAATQETS